VASGAVGGPAANAKNAAASGEGRRIAGSRGGRVSVDGRSLASRSEKRAGAGCPLELD